MLNLLMINKFSVLNQKDPFNVNMLISMVMLTFPVWNYKYPFWANLVQKNKIVSLRWNLLPIQLEADIYFSYSRPEVSYLEKFSPKIKIDWLRLSLILELLLICWIRYYCSFFWTKWKTFFCHIWSKKSRFSV